MKVYVPSFTLIYAVSNHISCFVLHVLLFYITEVQLEGLPEVTLPLQRLSLDFTDLYGSNIGF